MQAHKKTLRETCADLERRLLEAEQKAAYYQKLAQQAGTQRLRETETLSHLLAEDVRMRDALARSEARLRQIIDLLPHKVFVKDRTGRFLLVNRAVADSLNTTVEALTGRLQADVHPDPAEVARMLADDRQVIASGQMLIIPEERYTDANGKQHWQHTIKVPHVTADTAEPAILGVAIDMTEHRRIQESLRSSERELQEYREHLEELVRERTRQLEVENAERKRIEAQLTISLREKEVLLKEVYHRVKNNLQVISSLLNLQASLLPDGPTRELFKESQSRVRSMSLIHEKLYQSDDLSQINFANYVRTLVYELMVLYRRPTSQIMMRFELAEAYFPLDIAIPCGLVVNELVSNVLKYAFPHGEGMLDVRLESSPEGWYTLLIADNGVGFAPDLEMEQLNSLGLQLVQGLVQEQLNGTLELDRQSGTAWRIRFRA